MRLLFARTQYGLEGSIMFVTQPKATLPSSATPPRRRAMFGTMMWLTRLLHPAADEKPPRLIKIGVAVQVVTLIPLLGRVMNEFGVTYFASLIAEAVVLFGIYRMRRWGAVGFAVLVALTTITVYVRLGGQGALGTMFGLSLRATALLPCFLFWDRMTWSGEAQIDVAARAPDEPLSRDVARLACAGCGDLTDTRELTAGRCAACVEADR